MDREFKIALSQEYYSDIVYLSQYDTDYNLVFTVMDKYANASGIDGFTAKFTGTRNDTLGFTFDSVAQGNTVAFEINTSLTAVSGTHKGEIVFYDTNGLYFGTANVQIIVEPAARPDGTIDADVERAQEIAEQVQEIVDNAAATVSGEAEKWATGQIDGTDVPSTDPAYENNAKYYAEQAADAAASIGIDATLTQAGKAADAKKTGDEITALKEELSELAIISNGNLIDFGEHQLNIDGVSISISKDKLTINGTIGTSAIRLKLTGNIEYDRTSSNPSAWNEETVDLFESGKSYNAYTEKLNGTITGTGDVFTFRDGTGTTVLSASKGTVVITDRVAYGMFYFKYGQTFDNVTYQIVLTQSSERIPIADLAEKKLKPDVVVPYADDVVKSVMGSMPKEYTSTAFFTETAYASTHEMQGVTSDGTYLYYCMHGATDADNSVVGKIDLSNNTLVNEVSNYCYKHANGLCYYPDGNELRIAPLANSGIIYQVDADTLEYKDDYDIGAVIGSAWTALTGETLSVAGIAYNSTHDMFIYLLSKTSGIYHGLAICTSDNQLIKIIKCITDYTALRGGITCDDKYIYLCLGDVDGSRTKAILRAYDWNGNVINDATFVSPHTFEGVSLGERIFASFANDTITELTVAEYRTISLLNVLGHFNPN